MRSSRLLPALGVVLAIAALAPVTLSSGTRAQAAPQQSSTAARSTTDGIASYGRRWFASGANQPTLHGPCDFGCQRHRGVLANRTTLNRAFARMQRNGVKVVRWNAFALDAQQMRRDATGMPLGLRTTVYPDFDEAVRLARRYDLHLVFVLFPHPEQLPATWTTDAAQRDRLARELQPLFRRYGRNPHVLAWEVFDEPERAIDAGRLDLVGAQQTVARIAAAVHATSRAQVTVGSQSIDRTVLWKGLGLDFFAPHWFSSMSSGPQCATCTTAAALRAQLGLDAPVVIGAFDAPTAAASRARYADLYARGYAGAWAWSILPVPHLTLGRSSVANVSGAWHLMYAHDDVGPRARPRNACLGPAAPATLLCPDLRMSPPSSFMVRRTRGGRTLLLSRNSINNMGRGPAELRGTRNGPLTMSAVQKIHRRRGRKLTVATGARLLFKAIPGQYRYWKWNGAATMELWRLDGAANAVELVRRGPKTVYCLRDLTRTHGGLPRAPRARVYPGCSQSLGIRSRTLGTSVGWSDIYPSTYHENWIDVTGLRGCFTYVHIADPDDVMYESDETNNTSRVTVRLPFRGSGRGCPRASTLSVGPGGGLY